MAFRVDGCLVFFCALAALVSEPSLAQSEPPHSQTNTDPPLSDPVDLSKLDPAIDWSVLNTDVGALVDSQGRTITIVPTRRDTDARWNRTDNNDGSSAISVDRSLPTVWDTKLGVDFAVPTATSPLLTPDRLLAGTSADQTGGAAWARTTAPGLNLPIGWDKASFEARIDPMQEQSKLDTRLSKSLPLNEQMSVTMESGFAVTHLRSQVMPNAYGSPSNVFDTERLAKLNFLATGTSIGAGSRKSSTDDVWLNSVIAEQKLFSGISITGTVSETLEGQTNKSLTAGFKRNW